jgi:hypothetical protein
MRAVSLRTAEFLTWIAICLTSFLAFRVFAIYLTLINPATCNDSCDMGHSAIRVFLAVFVVGWFPWLLLLCISYARRHAELWWLPHCLVIAGAYIFAMVYVATLFMGFSDADGRTPFLALSAAVTDALATLVLIAAVVVDRNIPPDTRVHFFQEDAGE